MIKNIIFDFGDIFINLDKQIIFKEIENFGGLNKLSAILIDLNQKYEVGAISSETFINELVCIYPNASPKEIIRIWNSMLLDLPDYRLKFIENLSLENRYRLFLLSNTNELHIDCVEKNMGTLKYNRFKNSFEKFYLSHEIHLRKPNAEIYKFVLDENDLVAKETFFIDDTKENIDAAKKLGINCWHLNVGSDDIINLKNKL